MTIPTSHMAAALAIIASRAPSDEWRDGVSLFISKPTKTPKRAKVKAARKQRRKQKWASLT